MYTRMNEEIERTPWTVKALLCSSAVSTLLLIIMFTAFLVSLSDLGTLLTDGSDTLQDMKLLVPEARKSLALLEKLCHKHPNMC